MNARVVAALALAVIACDATFSFDEQSIEGGAGTKDGGAESGDGSSSGPCTSDTQCGGLRCDLATNVCVACLGNDDCKDPGRRFCAKPLENCVECVEDTSCGARRRCDTTASRCVDTCADGDEQCPSGLSCNESRKLCVECRGNANCSGHPSGPYCDTAIGRCVECASSAQCPTEKPTCDRRSGRCVECLTSNACGGGRVCDPSALTCRTP